MLSSIPDEEESGRFWPDGLTQAEITQLTRQALAEGAHLPARPERDPEHEALRRALYADTGRPDDPYTCDYTADAIAAASCEVVGVVARVLRVIRRYRSDGQALAEEAARYGLPSAEELIAAVGADYIPVGVAR